MIDINEFAEEHDVSVEEMLDILTEAEEEHKEEVAQQSLAH